MNPSTTTLVSETVTACQALLREGWQAAVVAYGGDAEHTLVDTTYWAEGGDGVDFEAMAGEHARLAGARRVVFAVPLSTDPAGQFAAPDEEEEQMIWAVSVDLGDGLDIHRCEMTGRERNYQFGPLQTFEGEIQLLPGSPGAALLAAFVQ